MWPARDGTEVQRDMEISADEVSVMNVHVAIGRTEPVVIMADHNGLASRHPPLRLIHCAGHGGRSWSGRTQGGRLRFARPTLAMRCWRRQSHEYRRLPMWR